jgi:hypothetical protein
MVVAKQPPKPTVVGYFSSFPQDAFLLFVKKKKRAFAKSLQPGFKSRRPHPFFELNILRRKPFIL